MTAKERFEDRTHGVRAEAPGFEAGGIDALRAALADWKYALTVFDSAEDPVTTELASIRLDEAGRRFGCLAGEHRRARA